MRVPEDKIKQAILHQDREVRHMAIEYFSKADCQDPNIMPLVIEAIARYGREWNYSLIGRATGLKQTDDTILWMVDELNKDIYMNSTQEDRTNYYFNLTRVLCNSDLDLFFKHESKIVEAKNLFHPAGKHVFQKLEMYGWKMNACWQELEKKCIEWKDTNYVEEVDTSYINNLTDVMAYHKEEIKDKVIDLLNKKIEHKKGNPMIWMEPFIVKLAGKLKLKEVIPIIIKKLQSDNGDYLNECCQSALVSIGTNVVIQAVYQVYLDSEWHFRLYSNGVFEKVKTDLAVERCLDLVEREENVSLKTYLARGLLSQFSERGINVVYQIVKSNIWDHAYCDLKKQLLIACTIMGKGYPESDMWKKQIEEDGEARRKRSAAMWEGILPKNETTNKVFGRKVGRNKSCPCGSGKKYKKCCGV